MKSSKYLFTIVSLFTVFISTSVGAIEPSFKLVEEEIKLIEEKLSAHIGVTVLDTQSGEQWSYKGNARVPLTSTFKTIACAKLLNDADNEKVSLDNSVIVKKEALVAYSPVTEKYVGRKLTYNEACSATMLTSDNTAANIVINAVGGPCEITNFIRSFGDDFTRLDRFEPELNESTPGDLRDTTTPNAIANTLNELLFGSVLSKDSQQQLQEWMKNNQVTGGLLRSVLPEGWEIADRSGAGAYGSRSITAVVWAQNYAPFIISIYITQTSASLAERNESIVKIGQLIFNVYLKRTAIL